MYLNWFANFPCLYSRIMIGIKLCKFPNDVQILCMYLFADWANVLAIYAGKYIIIMHM